ncbi:hypothetical protein KB874_04640 [Aestuariicoccus sp. KMU-90]|uniref:AlgX/AlgJ SGNH hydrolase-like domain-containing protein n=2 Tax=Thetidibacter halocola TaxID=2827239 RepID=A0A8J7WCZ7_9RHOB|nr:hypothetical protein [Thetidibacter halocola]
MRAYRLTGAVLALAALCAGGARAQDTGYGCRDLAGGALPSVEGEAGQFYRIDPDLMTNHRIPDEMIARLARLSEVLEAGGTRLIFLPMPTKALAAPQHLPPVAADLGFDPELAATVHDGMLEAMRAAGIAVVDGRRALRQAGQAAPVFFGPDPRPNPDGQRALAMAAAERIAQTPGFGALPKTRFVTLTGAEQDLPSVMRFRLQQQCRAELPPVRAIVSVSSLAPGAPQPGPGARVVVIGSDMTGAAELNLAGFLQEALGLPAQMITVPGGNALEAMTAYLTSRDFARDRPAYIVWENPVWQSLGQRGDQPLRELIAAAADTCRIALPVAAGIGGQRLMADLSSLQPGGRYTLMLDADSLSPGAAWFHFPAGADMVRSRSIHRGRDAPRSGRFFLPLDGLGALPPRVEVETDAPLGPQPRLMACPEEALQ